jgi:WGR domain
MRSRGLADPRMLQWTYSHKRRDLRPGIGALGCKKMGNEGAGGPKPRPFEFRGGDSAKFWEIVRQGESYAVTFGGIGTTGKSQTKELEDKDQRPLQSS